MIFAKRSADSDRNGIAALAIVKVLLEIMEKKQVLSRDEIDIILNCAQVEVDNTDIGAQAAEAKQLIGGLLQETDETTRGFQERTAS